MMLYRLILVVALLVKCPSVFAYTECEKNLMNTYLAYRSALLDVNYSTNAVLKILSPDFKGKFKSEANLKLFLLALRVKEAKIIKLEEFSAKCEDQKGEVNLKILFYEPEVSRLTVSIIKKDGIYYVRATTFESEMEKFDIQYKYQPIKLSERIPASLTLE